MAHGILVPSPGIEPGSSAVKSQSSNTDRQGIPCVLSLNLKLGYFKWFFKRSGLGVLLLSGYADLSTLHSGDNDLLTPTFLWCAPSWKAGQPAVHTY